MSIRECRGRLEYAQSAPIATFCNAGFSIISRNFSGMPARRSAQMLGGGTGEGDDERSREGTCITDPTHKVSLVHDNHEHGRTNSHRTPYPSLSPRTPSLNVMSRWRKCLRAKFKFGMGPGSKSMAMRLFVERCQCLLLTWESKACPHSAVQDSRRRFASSAFLTT